MSFLSINTGKRGNITRLSKAELEALLNKLEDDEVVLPVSELIEIGQTLIEHDRDTMDKAQMEQLVKWMRDGKAVSLRQVQNVFSDYATRAKLGKPAEGGRLQRRRRTLKRTKRNNKTKK